LEFGILDYGIFREIPHEKLKMGNYKAANIDNVMVPYRLLREASSNNGALPDKLHC
jgi:hypothetical protein